MIICVCKAVNDRAIRRAVAAGHDTFDEVQFELGVGTRCGKCVPAACEVLCEARAIAQSAAQSTTRPVQVVQRTTVQRTTHSPQQQFAIA